MIKITPLVKGIITSAVMIGVFLTLYYTQQPGDSPFPYLLDIIYAGGIAWTLVHYSRSDGYVATFRNIFNQGFRCFIVVTLIMVLFTWVFYVSHPEIKKEAAVYYREYLQENEKDRTPAQKEEMVAAFEKQFNTRTVSSSIFGFLIRGAIFTAAGAGLLLMRRK